ncbi:MAG TPA: MarR family transcriptional regulator [Gaiellaceae bacterium]|nr:MarR family transcriptional regulator [Gaiellaceae bacterium]
MSQVLSEQSLGVRAFAALIRAHSSATRRLSSQLTTDHGLTISDYEVLLRLARAPDRRLRRVDLAEQVLLTASGITRLLDGLEQSGLVERGSCATDRRVVYAVLTDAGLAKVRDASKSHFAQVDQLFTEYFGEEELEAVGDLLSRIGGSDPRDCDPT